MADTMTFSDDDVRWMARALELARRGLYTTHPNPRVGCVLVRDGVVVGEGWHVRPGEPHAEVHALRMAGDAARGATAYVTLEPCAHTGRTPPCADALVRAGVARVVAAIRDPFPQVDGRGFDRLRAAGIVVESCLLAAEAEALNAGFLQRVRHGRPWVRLKLAISLDGRVAMASGESRWITGPAARRDVHHQRACADLVLTGIGTVLADDPRLDVRDLDACDPDASDLDACGPVSEASGPDQVATGGVACVPRQPARAVLDRLGRTPSGARILAGQGDTLVFRHAGAPVAGAVDVPTPLGGDDRLDLTFVFAELGRRGFNEVLVECGGTLAAALLAAGHVDELLVYQSPTLLGATAQPMVALRFEHLAERLRFRLIEATPVGEDLRLRFGRAEAIGG